MELAEVVRFCKAPDGVRLAYAVTGDGPPLVKAANWLTRLDREADSPIWGHWIRSLAAGHTLVRYDQRGCGLSDWDAEDLSLDAFVGDLEAVVDDLGLAEFPLLGVSQAGPVAVAFAARHPDRVSRVVLHGTYARGRALRALDEDVMDVERAVMRAGWGRDDPAFRAVFAHRFFPHGSAEELRAFDELQSHTTSADMAVRIREAFSHFDVREIAPRIRCPVLVTHPRGDRLVPFAEGRMMASLIPGARFVPLAGDNHLMLSEEPAWRQFLDELGMFLEGAPAFPRVVRPAGTRVRRLATVLFADIVDSTGMAVSLGDARWSVARAAFQERAESVIAGHGGRILDWAGDGFLAVFDHPTPAVRAGVELTAEAATTDMSLRVGLHTGEVEDQEGRLSGIGVHMGARIGALAQPGEVWVSGTVKELVAGSGLDFLSAGTHHLKGIAEPRELFVVKT